MSPSGLQEAAEPWYQVVLAWLGRLIVAYLLAGGVIAVLMIVGVVPSSPLWVLGAIFWPMLVAHWLSGGK